MSEELTTKETKAYRLIYKEAVKVNKQLRQLKIDSDKSNPVDMDVVKTTKAMFYEKVITIIKNSKERKEE